MYVAAVNISARIRVRTAVAAHLQGSKNESRVEIASLQPMEPSTCIFNCRHPVWGGEGACSVDQHGAPVCLCDAGFASRDALGHANCVPFQALVSGYLVLAALSLLTLALLGHHLAGYRHVSDDARRSRRTAARLGALLCGWWVRSYAPRSVRTAV